MITQAQALEWIAGVFNQAVAELSAQTTREAVPAWDSIGVLILIAEFDEKFGIVLSDGDMREMRTVGDILGVLRRHGKLEASGS